VVSPFYVFTALGIVLGRALNGAGDSLNPMLFTVLTLWGLQLPLAVWLSRLWQPPTEGIWWAIAAAMTINGLLTAAWFQTGRWMHKRV
jgi:Na+-driven multidrug efflux pump